MVLIVTISQLFITDSSLLTIGTSPFLKHERSRGDLIEDLAISYGYNNLETSVPQTVAVPLSAEPALGWESHGDGVMVSEMMLKDGKYLVR